MKANPGWGFRFGDTAITGHIGAAAVCHRCEGVSQLRLVGDRFVCADADRCQRRAVYANQRERIGRVRRLAVELAAEAHVGQSQRLLTGCDPMVALVDHDCEVGRRLRKTFENLNLLDEVLSDLVAAQG